MIRKVLLVILFVLILMVVLDWLDRDGKQDLSLDSTELIFSTRAPSTTTTSPRRTQSQRSSRSGRRVNWDAIAECESGNNWSINTGNGYYGGLQFSHSTWISNGGGKYANNAHQTTRANQINIASGMSLSHWPTCGRRG